MPFTPKPPFPKAPGSPVRSGDWNELVQETQRLDTVKFEKAGGTLTGPLNVQGNVLAQGLTASGSANLKSSVDVAGALLADSNGVTVRGGFMIEATSTLQTAMLKLNTTARRLRVGSFETAEPPDHLDVAGSARIGSTTNPLRFTSQWSDFPATQTNAAEISNDIDSYKC